MTYDIRGCRIAVLATNGFEESELMEPVRALKEAGAIVEIISPEAGQIQGMKHHETGEMVDVDLTLEDANAEDYEALLLPGGVSNPDTLRLNKAAVDFVEYFNETGCTMAAICHGPWMLIEADMVRGRTLTSWPSLKTDLRNAGATWVDQSVVVDGNLITSRKPDDLKAFCQELIAAIATSKNESQTAAA